MNRSKRAEKERAEAEWNAEQERVRQLGVLFDALPEGLEKTALQQAMSDRVVELYNSAKFEQGDAIIEFLPNEYARNLLDWYFDDTDSIAQPNCQSST